MIIGIAGYARSGKDTVANYLVEKHGFTRYAFADVMRDALLALDPWIQMDSLPRIPLSQALRVYSWEDLKHHSEDVRPLLQRFGTEVGRNMFGQDFWVNQLMERVKAHATPVVISDVRYKNEATAVLQASGDIWHVERAGTGPANSHSSEGYLPDEISFDHYLYNDNTVEDLYAQVEAALVKVQEYSGKTI